MNSLFQNYINGNLTSARKQAKKHRKNKIREALQAYGFSPLKSALVATWLKTGEGYQAACDAN